MEAKPIPDTDGSSTGIASGDLDGDGDHDLVIARRDNAESLALINDGTGLFTVLPLPESAGDHRKVEIADLTGNGVQDIVLCSTQGLNKLYTTNGNSGFQPAGSFGENGTRVQALASVDIDNDGDIDLIEGTAAENAINYNLGNGSFERTVISEVKADTYGIAIGDLNNDGLPDVVFANSASVNEILLGRFR